MTDSIQSHLKKLKDLAPQVNQLADQAAKAVREIERLLVDDLQLTVSAETEVRDMRISPKTIAWLSLAFRRVNGKFRIAVVEEQTTDFVNDAGFGDRACKPIAETPWLECPRDLKLETFPKLPALLQAVIENVNKTVAAVQQAQPEVKEILDSMK